MMVARQLSVPQIRAVLILSQCNIGRLDRSSWKISRLTLDSLVTRGIVVYRHNGGPLKQGWWKLSPRGKVYAKQLNEGTE